MEKYLGDTFNYSKDLVLRRGDVLLNGNKDMLFTVTQIDAYTVTVINLINNDMVYAIDLPKENTYNFSVCFRGFKKEYFLLTYPELFL